MKKIVFLFLCLLFLSGCAGSENVTFSAVVDSVSDGSIMVSTISFDSFDKASVAVTDQTQVIGTLEAGAQAVITIKGEIRESYPVQVTATKIVITQDADVPAQYKKITAEEAKTLIESDDVVLLDVRTQEEYDEGHIDGALLIEDTRLKEQAPLLLTDKTAKILVYCRSGRRSAASAQELIEMGYTDVLDFGGIIDWPYETVTGTQLTQDEALAVIEKLSAEKLGLPVGISEYKIIFDDVKTEIDGASCYGLSAFADLGERMENMGVFYVAVDGSAIYKINSMTGDYEKIDP